MEITNELLSAYAEGNVTPEERKAVRQFLTEHPSQLESVMIMMDKDYEMEVESNSKDMSVVDSRTQDISLSASATAYSLSAFQVLKDMMDFSEPVKSTTFGERLDDLLDEIS